MARKKRKTRPDAELPVDTEKIPEDLPVDKLRLGLLAATVGTFVVRPLVASESAVLGDGLVLVMLLLLIGFFWVIGQLRQKRLRIRFHAVDAMVLLLLGLYAFSGLSTVSEGNVRSIVNMVWLWVGLTAGYFLLRQLLDDVLEVRAIVAVMIALAVAVAADGLYQYCWKFPQMRAAYAKNPDAMLRAEGMWYPPGSPERANFDSRINSREPLASFALTNSLAGFLAPWLIVTAGLLLQSTTTGDSKTRERVKPALMLLVIAVCFLLTKSRTAWAAVALGVIGLGFWWKLRGRTVSMKWIAVASVVIAVLIGIAIAAGGLDSEVVGEAGKSLQYRLEYWQSTARMIAADPWFGVGPGRYQEAYSRFKLPQASEDPSDPHNFLFEVAATAGLFALAAMLAVIVLFVATLLSRRACPSLFDETGDGLPGGTESDGQARRLKSDEQTRRLKGKSFVYLGALFGYLASLPIGAMGTVLPDGFIYWGALPVGALTLWGLDRWVRRGTISPGLLGIAWGVLTINLLAAGGISFPGVAASFWMLLALGFTLSYRFDASRREVSSRNLGVALAVLILVLIIACYFTAYGPVLSSKSRQDAAMRLPCEAEMHLFRAAEADPWAAEPWIQLAHLAYLQWKAEPTPERFEKFLRYDQEILKRTPNKAVAWFFTAKRNLEAYRRMDRPADLDRAIAAYAKAVELYPASALYRGQWSLALKAAGKEAEARREAAKALELDRQNPHQEKRLPEQLRKRLEKIADEKVELISVAY